MSISGCIPRVYISGRQWTDTERIYTYLSVNRYREYLSVERYREYLLVDRYKEYLLVY